MESLSKSTSQESIEEEYCRTIFLLERELGHFIDSNYPLMKFWEEVEQYQWYKKEEEKMYNG